MKGVKAGKCGSGGSYTKAVGTRTAARIQINLIRDMPHLHSNVPNTFVDLWGAQGMNC